METDAQQLRDDIEVLRVLIDRALDQDANRWLLEAFATVLRDRREQLDALEVGYRH